MSSCGIRFTAPIRGSAKIENAQTLKPLHLSFELLLKIAIFLWFFFRENETGCCGDFFL